jgi:VWFA-related protein
MRTPTAGTIAAFLALVLLDSRPFAQSGGAQREQPVYASTATAILVDVVVRDRRGRLVTDLTAADFQVAEDDVQQKIDSFTRVTRGSGIGVSVAWRSPETTVTLKSARAGEAPTATDPLVEQDTTIALVFDHLSAESLRLVQRAALDYIPMSGDTTGRVGVFAANPGIRVVQPYTTDRSRVRQAVARIQPTATSAQEQKADRTDELIARRRDLRADSAAAGGSTSATARPDTNASQIGLRETELRLIQTELNMIRSFENLDRDYRGYDTSLALLSVVQSLSVYPGRKAIVLFSEGLPASPALSAKLDSVIDAANRAHVTTYAVDANGLRAKSSLTAMRKEVDTFAEERFNQLATASDRTEQPLTMAFERVEDTLRLDSRTGLARLAEDTGGILVEGSNDLSSAFNRIDEDNQFHYLLTYSPTNTAFDGKFRQIDVDVRRPGTQVFARKGYRAIRSNSGSLARSLETAALSLLDRTPLPNAFPVSAIGLSFPDPARPGLTPLLVNVRTDALRFDVDARRSIYSGQLSIVVRVRDGQGREVETVSQQYLLTGEAKDLEAAKNGDILFYREVDLPPGIYTMDSAVLDVAGQRGSVRVATLNVPPAEPSSLGMSSLIVVHRIEEVADAPPQTASAAPPLYVGRTLIYPNLGQPIHRSSESELPFYFTLYGDTAGVRASAEILRNGEPIAEAPIQLPPGTGRRVQHIGRLPVGTFPAGTFELRIRVADTRAELVRSAFFTLRD